MDSHEFFTQPSTACHEIPGALASEGDEYMMPRTRLRFMSSQFDSLVTTTRAAGSL
jgi:hypothetical protein